MAFGGAQVNNTLPAPAQNVAGGVDPNYVAFTGLTLAARVGAPDITGAAADSGVFTTAAAGANQNQIPTNFGRTQGNWSALDLQAIQVLIVDPDGAAAAAGSFVHEVSVTLSGADILVLLHNKGAGPSGSLTVQLSYRQTRAQ